MELQTGSVLEFTDKGRERLAVVLRPDGKKRQRILIEDGREASITARQVNLLLPVTLNPKVLAQSTLVKSLETLRNDAESAKEEFGDGELLWELAVEEHAEGAVLSVEALSEMLFGEVEAVSRYATLLLVRAGDMYFKPRSGDFELRGATQVEQVRLARAAVAEREAAIEAFVAGATRIMALDADVRASVCKEARGDARFDERFGVMTEYAVKGDDYREAEAADEWLDAIEQRSRYRFDGRRSVRAFDLMVQLGHWHRDENLTLLRHQTPIEFGAEAMAQAEGLVADVSPEGRVDMTGVLTFSIDDEETRDIDDAISLEPLDGGGWRLGVHIADPSHHVPFDSPLELAARSRGATLYLPTGRIPMFPPSLSEGQFSLLQGELRPALSFLIELDALMEIVDRKVVASLIRVDERLTYDEASMLIEIGEDDVSWTLRELCSIVEMLHMRRQNAGAVQIQIPEIKVRVKDGEVVITKGSVDSFAQDIVSELMILANATAARFCYEHNLPVLYRSQEAPDPPLEEAGIMEVPEGLPRAFASVRCMRPATISMEPGSHAGLGVEAYVQATSPIRRYTDFVTHAQIHGALRDGEPTLDRERFSEVITLGEANSGDARTVSRDTERYWIMRYLESRRGGAPLTATIISYQNDRAHVVVDETMTRSQLTLRQRLPLGTQINVEILRCYPRAGYLQLQHVEEKEE